MRFLILLFFIFLTKNKAQQSEAITPGGDTILLKGLHPAEFDKVLFPCGECVKLLSKYVQTSQKNEVQSQKVTTFLSFCESLALSQDPKYNSSSYKYCLELHSRLLDDHKQPGVNKADYDPYENDVPGRFFLHYRLECEKFMHLPSAECYTGFCEKNLECIDCPSGLNLLDNEFNYELQVCSGHGVCRLGWLNDRGRKGGNGFCECFEGRKGLACDQVIGQGTNKLPENRVQIERTPGADEELMRKNSLEASERISERGKEMSRRGGFYLI